MEDLYAWTLREFERLSGRSAPGEISLSVPSISFLTITCEDDAVDLVWEEEGQGELMWALHVQPGEPPRMSVSSVKDGKDLLEDIPPGRADLMLQTILDQLSKIGT